MLVVYVDVLLMFCSKFRTCCYLFFFWVRKPGDASATRYIIEFKVCSLCQHCQKCIWLCYFIESRSICLKVYLIEVV